MTRTQQVVVLCAIVVAVSSLAGGLVSLPVSTDRAANNVAASDPSVQNAAAIDSIHEAGPTGENVSVGVLDVTGFDTGHPILENRIADSHEFGDEGPIQDAPNDHGTSVAITVAQIAPDAELYLGTVATADDYATGLEWLLEADVDVIVTPVADAGTMGDGDSALARPITDAVEQGVVVVAPAGNLGNGHWSGTYEPNEHGVHSFDQGPLNEVTGSNERAAFHLAWDDPVKSYRLELYRLEDDGTSTLVAQSLPREDGIGSSERLTATLDDDRYAIAVRGPDDEDVAERNPDTRIRVASTTHSLADNRSSGSVTAPATARGALSVGTYDPTSGAVEPFSSRGPTADGRLGVYVVAPGSHNVSGSTPFEGTSASAAYAGGVSALVLAADPDLEPQELRWTLASSADPLDGVDAESGHGRIDPVAAVSAVDPDLNQTDLERSSGSDQSAGD